MKTFKFFWNVHKWTGIVLAVFLFCTSVSGFLLLLKKKVDWIQPPTVQGAGGGVDDFICVRELFAVVLGHGHRDFQSMDDIDRVDFRPADRVFKVQSRSRYAEIQVCAVTGEVLSNAWRPSDLIEDIHDGSFWAGWFHDWFMPVVSAALLLMIASGLWLFVEPSVRRRRRHKRWAQMAESSQSES